MTTCVICGSTPVVSGERYCTVCHERFLQTDHLTVVLLHLRDELRMLTETIERLYTLQASRL